MTLNQIIMLRKSWRDDTLVRDVCVCVYVFDRLYMDPCLNVKQPWCTFMSLALRVSECVCVCVRSARSETPAACSQGTQALASPEITFMWSDFFAPPATGQSHSSFNGS